MNYTQTIDWLFERLPMYQRQGPASYKPNLDRIHALCTYLGQPHLKFPAIHVAGTNGKGSTCHMITAIYQQAGYRVGLYTSPHLHDFRERIRIGGKMLPKPYVVDFVSEHQLYFTKNKLSFFEMTVGLAFDYFANQQVDIAVIEVGLGGRLDATNIISPLVSVITNIGLDHTQFLGDTLEEIAREKAGIIKENTPVVIGEYQKKTYPIFKEIARQNQSEIYLASEQIKGHYLSDLQGDYQSKNIKTAVQAVQLTKQFPVQDSQIKAGLLSVTSLTGLKGRWTVLGDAPKVILDVAHNYEGLSLVVNQLNQESFDKLHIVFGSVSDKHLDSVFKVLPKNAQYYFCAPKIKRAMPVASLKECANKHGLKGQDFESVALAYSNALLEAKPNDLIFVGGSTFVVAEIN